MDILFKLWLAALVPLHEQGQGSQIHEYRRAFVHEKWKNMGWPGYKVVFGEDGLGTRLGQINTLSNQ